MGESIIRGSEYSSFLKCRKQWLYQWVEQIEPKRPDGKLFIGTVFHKFLEYYYQLKDFTMALNKTDAFIRAHDLSAMEQVEIDEMKKLFQDMSYYYDDVYASDFDKWNVLATELQFLVKLEGDIYMTGTIDLIVEEKETGHIYFLDHKTTSQLSIYEQKAAMDRQISRYWWALRMIQDGVGRIKDTKTGEWVVWNELNGKEIKGFIYNLIAKDTPREPKVLKSGKLSTDKSQKTTYDKFIEKMFELGFESGEYTEILTYLRDKPNPFLKRINIYRNDSELESAAFEFYYTAQDITKVKEVITNAPSLTEHKTYRNITNDCMNMCSYRAICQTAIEGGNVSLVKNLSYRQKEEV
jgi:hypothetical protein